MYRVSASITIALCTAFVGATVSAQQTYPNRPVRLVSGYAAGGTTSLIGRLLGQRLAEAWGQQFVLDNRPGGGTLIAGEIVAKSAPDGHTLMLMDSAHAISPLLFKAPFDPVKDFTFISRIAHTEWILLVHPALPAKSLTEFLGLAKARRGKLNYASPAIGGAQHLGTEVFNTVTGIEMNHVPYKGAGPALVALVAGEVDVYYSTTATGAPHVKTGRARALAITGKQRSPLLPDVPTVEEAGLSNYNFPKVGFGVIGPAGIPKSIVEKLTAEINKHVSQGELRNTLINVGLNPHPGGPQEHLEAVKQGLTTYADVINQLKKKGVRFD
jgi:tripartite-type tricarboxylate transporter receptor subunit TctC